jgi:hypothetical protein
MPRKKESSDSNTPSKKKNRPRKGSIHPKLAHLAGAEVMQEVPHE